MSIAPSTSYTDQTILPPRWEPLRYHKQQAEAYHSDKRFVNLACGRRSGKTEIARRKIVAALAIKKPWVDPCYFMALPTYAQAKKVAWKPILDMIPKAWVKNINVMEQSIETIFGSTLYIVGLDQPQRIEGLGYDGGIIDEACDQKPNTFALSIRPALSDRQGWCWRIGVPKRFGVGSFEFKEAFDRGLDPTVENTASYSWPSSDILPAQEISDAQRELSKDDFEEQYQASWLLLGGLVFRDFNNDAHVANAFDYDPELDIYVGMDFNVDPMAWVLGHVREVNGLRTLCIFDELFIRHTNTLESLREMRNRYPKHQKMWRFYGDAASKARKTSASSSDYLQIVNFPEIPKKKKMVTIPNANPVITDRFAATNAVLMNAADEVRIIIHPCCKYLIRDLRTRSFKEGTSIPNDSPDIGHITDALGYLIWIEWPLKVAERPASRVSIRAFK